MTMRGTECHAQPGRDGTGAGCNMAIAQNVLSVSGPLAEKVGKNVVLSPRWGLQCIGT
jgi:hypothetical protein